jgi:hypothetical protein
MVCIAASIGRTDASLSTAGRKVSIAVRSICWMHLLISARLGRGSRTNLDIMLSRVRPPAECSRGFFSSTPEVLCLVMSEQECHTPGTPHASHPVRHRLGPHYFLRYEHVSLRLKPTTVKILRIFYFSKNNLKSSTKLRLESDKNTVATSTIRVLDHHGFPRKNGKDNSSKLPMIFLPVHPENKSEVQHVTALRWKSSCSSR